MTGLRWSNTRGGWQTPFFGVWAVTLFIVTFGIADLYVWWRGGFDWN